MDSQGLDGGLTPATDADQPESNHTIIQRMVDMIDWETRPNRASGIIATLQVLLDQDRVEAVSDQAGLDLGHPIDGERDPLDLMPSIDQVWSGVSMGSGTDDGDPLEDQVRDESNPDLVRQHEKEEDPLDEAIIEEHERAEETDATPVQEGRLNPPPVDEHD